MKVERRRSSSPGVDKRRRLRLRCSGRSQLLALRNLFAALLVAAFCGPWIQRHVTLGPSMLTQPARGTSLPVLEMSPSQLFEREMFGFAVTPCLFAQHAFDDGRGVLLQIC